MKELLKELGFEHLPMLSEFVGKARITKVENINIYYDYRDFITQPLTKGMFIPCDEDGWVLINPKVDDNRSLISDEQYGTNLKTYQQAEDRVLFEGGFGYIKKDNSIAQIGCNRLYMKGTIEQAINAGVKFILK